MSNLLIFLLYGNYLPLITRLLVYLLEHKFVLFFFFFVALLFGDRNQQHDQLDCRFPVIFFFPIRTTGPVNLKHLWRLFAQPFTSQDHTLRTRDKSASDTSALRAWRLKS